MGCKRRGIAALLAAVSLLWCLTGCGQILYGEKVELSGELSGKLTMTGSTSMTKVCQALGEAFQEKYPGVVTEKSGTGSGEAPQAVLNGTAPLGDLSRDLREEEHPEAFEQLLVAIDGIALAVSRENPVQGLTSEQVSRIFRGEITNWKEVGGEDLPITLLGRESSSGTRDGFESLFGVEGCSYDAELTSTGEVVTRISSDPGAIGYVSLESLNDSVRGLAIDGAEPTEENIIAGTYQVQRPFLQVYKKGTDSRLVAAWVEFVESDEGQQVIEQAGLIPSGRMQEPSPAAQSGTQAEGE